MSNKEIFLKDYTVPEYLIETVDLTFEFNNSEKSKVYSILKCVKNPESKSNDLILKADSIELVEIKINGELINKDSYEFDGKVFTMKNLPEEFTFEATTLIDPENNDTLMGVYRSNGMFCSQCESEGFRRITLHPDRPDVLSLFTTTIIADKKTNPILLSNGNKILEKDLEDGRHMVKWEDPHKKPCYLFAVVAGDLSVKEDTFTTMTGKNVDLKIFTDHANITKVDFAMESLKRSMKWDEEKYGREYDLNNFMIVAVDAFNFGAMENKGLNIFNSRLVLATAKTSSDAALEQVEAVVGHEYFHNWSGNRVTCRDWFQLSLKEGLTVYRDSTFSQDMGQGVRKRIEDVSFLKSLQFSEDSSPMSHPIQPQSYEEIDNFYTVTVYEKGAEVVRMYNTLLGADGFRKGTDLYFDTFDGQAVRVEDFRNSMEKANNVDLSQFHNWYVQEGTPVIKVEEDYSAESKTYTIKLSQNIKQGQKPFYMPIKFGLLDKNGNDINDSDLLILKDMEQNFVFENISEKPTLSILREFSAPVKLDFVQSDDDLLFLAKNDNDMYNRYNAGQVIKINSIKQAIADLESNKAVLLDDNLKSLFKSTFTDSSIGLDVLALFLKLPDQLTIEQEYKLANPVLIKNALKDLSKLLSKEFEAEFKSLFDTHYNKGEEYTFNSNQVNKRSLICTVINYLSKLDKQEYLDLVKDIFDNANNMTYQSAMLRILLNSNNKDLADYANDKFYSQWSDDNNVVDTWFVSNASSDKKCDVDGFIKLQSHELFNYKQPNKVRALAAFTSNKHFHTEQGYKAFADLIIHMDTINGHVSTSLVRKLISYKNYANPFADLMLAQLKRINESAQSAGLKEMLSKSL